MNVVAQGLPASDPRPREALATLPVYGQLPFVPERAAPRITTGVGIRVKLLN